jgi:hypothetical protein
VTYHFDYHFEGEPAMPPTDAVTADDIDPIIWKNLDELPGDGCARVAKDCNGNTTLIWRDRVGLIQQQDAMHLTGWREW